MGGKHDIMNRFTGAFAGVLAASTALALGGCHILGMDIGGSTKAPTGQVVATVEGKEITVRDLRSEMGAANTSDPKIRKQAEQATLRNIVGRTVLAKAAVDRGVDKTPDFAIAKQKLVDGLLVQALQNKIAGQVPAVTKEEADRFVLAHPDLFAQRKVFSIDFVRMARPNDPAVIKALQPLKTLEEVETQLKQEKIPYQRSQGNLDSVGADPRMIEAIVKLPPGEMFVIPNGASLLVNAIRDTKIVPFTGAPASDYAQKLIARQRTQEAVNREFNAIIAKAAPNVRFNKDYAAPLAPVAGGAIAGKAPQAAGQHP